MCHSQDSFELFSSSLRWTVLLLHVTVKSLIEIECCMASRHLALKLGSPMGTSHVIFQISRSILMLTTLITCWSLANPMLRPHVLFEVMFSNKLCIAALVPPC